MDAVKQNTTLSFSSMDVSTVAGKRLSHLMRTYPALNVLGTLEQNITSVAFDSRRVEPGGLFVAIHGLHKDGSRFIQDALHRGAVAFITEAPFDQVCRLGIGSGDITAITVEDCRDALSWISARFYDDPSRDLNLFGVTGTNGKTTLTYILESIFKSQGEQTGVIGSINYRYNGVQTPAPITTPESLDINRMLRAMVEKKVTHCALEVSSHSLALKRVHGMHFAVGIFTNLSRDHLDFHETMENYKNAKKSFFHNNIVEKRVLNLDDPVGREILSEPGGDTLTTGIDSPADVMAENCVLTSKGSRFTLKTPFGSTEVETRLLGLHNIRNLLSSAATALLQGISLDGIGPGMRSIDRIPGRFECLDRGQDFTVVVDYAHTDDALRNALQAARALTRNRILVLFGCGGDRDRGKRKEMGRVALELSDFAIITSDNPRSEDPLKIIDDICEGIPASARENDDYTILPDRTQAIEFAIDHARKGDMVLIAGKGHEDYQILNTGTIHFDDREVAENCLKKRLKLD